MHVPQRGIFSNMEYNKIIAVTGMPGLYELLSSKSDGAIVRSLDDKTTKFVSSRIHNFSHLESIEVYTVRDNVNLVDILKAMEESKDKLPDDKDGEALKAYFAKVYPDLDFTRVYSSDLKKMVKWFSVLKSNNIEIKLTEPEAEEETADENAEVEKAPPAKEEKKKEPAVKKVEAKETAKKAETPAKQEKSAEKPAKAHTADKTEKPAAARKAAGKATTEKKEKAEKKPAAKATKAASKSNDKPKKSAKKK